MAEEFKLNKINIRSPYYINVVNKSDQTQDEIDPTPTEPLVNNFTHECGNTVSIGSTSSRNIYSINIANRTAGTFTINFSNLKVPIKYRFGMEGSLPAFQTSSGVNLYEPQWLSETGETVSLSNFITNPNGVSQAITYDVTQADLDSGNNLILEIFHPVTSAGYSFSSVCQDTQAEESFDSLDVDSVIIVTVIKRSGAFGAAGQTFGGNFFSNTTGRYVFAAQDLSITPTHPDAQFFREGDTDDYETWNSISNTYEGSLSSNDGVNLRFNGAWQASPLADWDIDYIISRHPIYQDAQNNWKFKTWADGEEKVQAIKITVDTTSRCAYNDSAYERYNLDIEMSNTAPITRATFDPYSNASFQSCGSGLFTYELTGSPVIIQDA